MISARKFSDNLVFIAFSDTHGDAEKLTRLHTIIEDTIKRDRAANPNVKHVLLIPGDVFSVNGIFSTISKGQFDIDTIAAIANLFPEELRFFTPGNHDFFYGKDQLLELIKKAKLRTIVSNTEFEKDSGLTFEKTGFFVVDNELIILGGLMTPETLNCQIAKKLHIAGNTVAAEAVEKEAITLETQAEAVKNTVYTDDYVFIQGAEYRPFYVR